MKTAYITMDVESFYDTSCVKRLTENVDEKYHSFEQVGRFLDLLKDEGIKATFFLNAEYASEYKDFLLRAKNEGHEIAVHCLKHISPAEQTDTEFESDLAKAKTIVSEIFDVDVKGYRAPCFGLPEEKVQIVKKLFAYDSSSLNFKKADGAAVSDLSGFDKVNDSLYVKEGFFEYPVLQNKILGKTFPICGGGYVRMTPWFLMKRAVFDWIKKSDGYMFYVHPFELSEKKLPRIEGMKFHEKLFLNRGRKNYLKKIAIIIKVLKKNGYVFKTMRESLCL